MKEPIIVRVAPNKNLKKWTVVREGDKEPCATNKSKTKAVKIAKKMVERQARPAWLLVHKTRYIVESSLQFSH